jgi:hypothetical protein
MTEETVDDDDINFMRNLPTLKANAATTLARVRRIRELEPDDPGWIEDEAKALNAHRTFERIE